MSEAVFFVAVIGSAALAGLVGALRSRRWGDEEKTPVNLPTLLPENAGLVAVLRTVAEDIEASGRRCADGLRDIARVIQVSATEPVEGRMRERLGDLVEHHAGVVKRGGQRIREGTNANNL